MPNDFFPKTSILIRFVAFTAFALLSTQVYGLQGSGQKQAVNDQENQAQLSDAQREENLRKFKAKREASFKHVFKLKVSAGEYDRVNELVVAPIWFEGIEPYPIEMVDEEGNKIFGDITEPQARKVFEFAKDIKDPNDIGNPKIPAELTFQLPRLEAGKSITYTCRRVERDVPPRLYQWDDDKTKIATLNHDGQPIFRSMFEKIDNSSQERRDATYKVYHHVFSPDGERLLTKGPGGKFPHHRGIFFGYNRISYELDGPKKADIWHLRKGESQNAEQMFHRGGVTSARSMATLSWKGRDDMTFAVEQRDLLFHKSGDATCVDVRVMVQPVVLAEMKLAGDPQHAGVHFRASQLVPDHTANLTYYLRPDGKAKPGEFRNWSDKPKETEINKAHINLPWLAICFSLPEVDEDGNVVADSKNFEKYTVCYLNADSNPKPSRFSERDYGRFGSYIPTTIPSGKFLNLDYRYWIFKGEKTVEEIDALSKRFENPVTVEFTEE